MARAVRRHAQVVEVDVPRAPDPDLRVAGDRRDGDAAERHPLRPPEADASDPDAALTTAAVLVAPVVEEALKGVLVLLVWWVLGREFDGVTDGMVRFSIGVEDWRDLLADFERALEHA